MPNPIPPQFAKAKPPAVRKAGAKTSPEAMKAQAKALRKPKAMLTPDSDADGK